MDLSHDELELLMRAAFDRGRLAAFYDVPDPDVTKAWDEKHHPRGDDGKFINKGEISQAAHNPAKAAELRSRVTDPAERRKLDTAITDTKTRTQYAQPSRGFAAGIGKPDKKQTFSREPSPTRHVGEHPTPDRPTVDETVGALRSWRDAGFTSDTLDEAAKMLAGHSADELQDIKRQLGLKASGRKADLANKILLQAAGFGYPEQGFTGKLYAKDGTLRHYEDGVLTRLEKPSEIDKLTRVSVEQAHAAIDKHIRNGTILTDAGKKEIAGLLTYGMTGRDIDELKGRLGLKASGRRKELYAERIAFLVSERERKARLNPSHPLHEPDPFGEFQSRAERLAHVQSMQARYGGANAVHPERQAAVHDAAERLQKALSSPWVSFSPDAAASEVKGAVKDLISGPEYLAAAAGAGLKLDPKDGAKSLQQLTAAVSRLANGDAPAGAQPEPVRDNSWVPSSPGQANAANHTHAVTGDTYKNREAIKRAGGAWDATHRQWTIDKDGVDFLPDGVKAEPIPGREPRPAGEVPVAPQEQRTLFDQVKDEPAPVVPPTVPESARKQAEMLKEFHQNASRHKVDYDSMAPWTAKQVREGDAAIRRDSANKMRNLIRQHPDLMDDYGHFMSETPRLPAVPTPEEHLAKYGAGSDAMQAVDDYKKVGGHPADLYAHLKPETLGEGETRGRTSVYRQNATNLTTARSNAIDAVKDHLAGKAVPADSLTQSLTEPTGETVNSPANLSAPLTPSLRPKTPVVTDPDRVAELEAESARRDADLAELNKPKASGVDFGGMIERQEARERAKYEEDEQYRREQAANRGQTYPAKPTGETESGADSAKKPLTWVSQRASDFGNLATSGDPHWVRGKNTFQHKDSIRNLGGKWHQGRQAWYIPGDKTSELPNGLTAVPVKKPKAETSASPDPHPGRTDHLQAVASASGNDELRDAADTVSRIEDIPQGERTADDRAELKRAKELAAANEVSVALTGAKNPAKYVDDHPGITADNPLGLPTVAERANMPQSAPPEPLPPVSPDGVPPAPVVPDKPPETSPAEPSDHAATAAALDAKIADARANAKNKANGKGDRMTWERHAAELEDQRHALHGTVRTVAEHEAEVNRATKTKDAARLADLAKQEPAVHAKHLDNHLAKLDKRIAKMDEANTWAKHVENNYGKVKWDGGAEATYGTPKEAIEYGFPKHLIADPKKGETGTSIEDIASQMMGSGSLTVPSDRHAEDYLLEKMASGETHDGSHDDHRQQLADERAGVAAERDGTPEADKRIVETLRAGKTPKGKPAAKEPAVEPSTGTGAMENPHAAEGENAKPFNMDAAMKFLAGGEDKTPEPLAPNVFNASTFVQDRNGKKEKLVRWPFHGEMSKRLRDGSVSASEVKQHFAALTANPAAVIDHLSDTLKQTGMRSPDKIRAHAENIYDRALSSFSQPGSESVSYMMPASGDKSAWMNAKLGAHKKVVDGLTDEHIAAHAKKFTDAAAERTRIQSNPESYDDFSRLVSAKGESSLTPEQKEKWDSLQGERRRETEKATRDRSAVVQAPLEAGGEGIAHEIHEGFHTKHNKPLHIVKLGNRVGGDTFKQLAESARKLGGNYQQNSKWTGGKSPDGFNFDTREGAERFGKLLGGESVSRAEDWEAARGESRQSTAERLKALSQSMHESADDELNRDRKTNTRRRADMAASSEAGARNKKAMADTIARLAEHVGSGKATHLNGIRHRSQVEALEVALRKAKYAKEKHDGISYQDSLSREVGAEDIAHAEYPYPYFGRSDITSMVGKMRETPGAKRIGERLAKFSQKHPENGDYVQDSSILADLSEIAKSPGSYGLDKSVGDMLKYKMNSYMRTQAADIKTAPELRAALREYFPLRSKPKSEDPIKAAERSLIGQKIPGFFPTPRPVIDEMLNRADIQAGHKVLDPSAGKGDILDAVKEHHPDADTYGVEINSTLADLNKKKGHNVDQGDYLEKRGGMNRPDRIVMNPPFENGQDIDHVQTAYDHLAPGGKMVAVMSEGPFSRSDKKAAGFRDWLSRLGGEHESMPEGSFAGSDAFRQTGVRTRMVTIAKPQNDPDAPDTSTTTGKASAVPIGVTDKDDFESRGRGVRKSLAVEWERDELLNIVSW